MAPVGTAGYVFVATIAVFAVFLGACAGAAAWAVRSSLRWAGLVAAAGFLAATVLLGSYTLTAAAILGGPPLILTFLTSWLTARYLERRARWRHIWATLVGLGCAVLLGFLYLRLLGLALGFPGATRP